MRGGQEGGLVSEEPTMRKAFTAIPAAFIFASPAYAQIRVHADPWALDPPIVRIPPSTNMGLARQGGYFPGPRYPAPLRDLNNPRAEYGFGFRNFDARR
jgi:hypothetical protein